MENSVKVRLKLINLFTKTIKLKTIFENTITLLIIISKNNLISTQNIKNLNVFSK